MEQRDVTEAGSCCVEEDRMQWEFLACGESGPYAVVTVSLCVHGARVWNDPLRPLRNA